MSYQFHNITNFEPSKEPFYFFDTNIWLPVLSGQNGGKSNPYVDFFESVIALNQHKGKALRKLKSQKGHQPKIVMTSLLMSEIFNAYMRQIAMKIYYPQRDLKDKQYKKDYRNTVHHANQLSRLKAEFLNYSPYFVLKNDKFGNQITDKEVCNQLQSDADFNDFYYYYMLQEDKIPIVTGDGDFIFQDLKIITANHKLLKL